MGSIFTDLSLMVTSMGGALVNAFTSVSNIFYDEVNSEPTIVGVLLVAALAVGFIKLALNLIVRLFTRVK